MKLRKLPVHGHYGLNNLNIQLTDDHVKLILPDFTLEVPYFNTWSLATTVMHTGTLHTPDDTFYLERWAAIRLARFLRLSYLPRHGLLRDNQGFTWLVLGDMHSDGRGECLNTTPTPSSIRRAWLEERIPVRPDDRFHRRINDTPDQLRTEAQYLRECRETNVPVTARQIVRGEAGQLPF